MARDVAPSMQWRERRFTPSAYESVHFIRDVNGRIRVDNTGRLVIYG